MSRYLRHLGGAQIDARDGGVDRRDRRQPGARQHRHPDRFRRCRKAGSTSACATPSSARRRGCTTTSATPCSPSCAPTSSTSTSPRAAASPRSASSPSARAISTCARRSTSSASTRSSATISASASTRSAARGRSAGSDLKQFADGLELIIVVEEKRSLIEVQVREELYGTANQPVCIGKKDEQGNWLFPVKGALDPNEVAICIGERILQRVGPERGDRARAVARLKEAQRILAETKDVAVRTPYFCSGCPHNSSTVVPEGMRAYAGHRLPLHGAMDGPLDARLHPDGRGGRQLDRRGAVLQAHARVPESRRRHLQPFRLHGDPRRDRLGRQHHLQDPVQRRRRHDRRPGQ